jgi:hypothetical protein
LYFDGVYLLRCPNDMEKRETAKNNNIESSKKESPWYKDPFWWFIGLVVIGVLSYAGYGEIIIQGLLMVGVFAVLVFIFSIKGGLSKKLFLLVAAALVFGAFAPLFRLRTQPVSQQAIISYPASTIKSNSDKTIPTESTGKSGKTIYPTVEPTESNTVSTNTTTDYDSELGNNWVAAKYAGQLWSIANNAAAGYVESIYLELSPAEVGNKSEKEYKKSVSSVFLTVKVDGSYWNTTDDDSKKDFVVAFVTSVGNMFRGYPHVYITNGVRTVAEGSYNTFKTEPKVTLK